MAWCPNCENELGTDVPICDVCGYRFGADGHGPHPLDTPDGHRPMSPWVAAFIGVFVGLAALFGLIIFVISQGGHAFVTPGGLGIFVAGGGIAGILAWGVLSRGTRRRQ